MEIVIRILQSEKIQEGRLSHKTGAILTRRYTVRPASSDPGIGRVFYGCDSYHSFRFLVIIIVESNRPIDEVYAEKDDV